MREPRTLYRLAGCLLLTACGGGGGGVDSNTPAPPAPAAPTAIELLDSIPKVDATDVALYRSGFSLSHRGQSGAGYDLNITCSDDSGLTIERDSIDIPNVTQLLEHRFSCPDHLDPNTVYEMSIETSRSNGLFEGRVSFTSGSTTPGLNVLAQTQTSREEVESLFDNYITGGLVDELDLPPLLEQLVISAIIDLAGSEWQNLANPNVAYGTTVQRVAYASISPDGKGTANLSGLIAFPNDLAAVKRDQMILLNHATGSTPSEFNTSDAWFIIAQLFAGRGYLVIAPDNYGRGSTADSSETYLLAGRTGANTADLVQRVLEDESYNAYYFSEVSPAPITVIGYSQGGHSAIASWLEIIHHHKASLLVDAVYAGGAPFDLYRTFRGVLQTVNNTCAGDGFCNLVDPDVLIPFASDRILPGLIAYTDTGVEMADFMDGEYLQPAFVEGFLGDNIDFDNLRALLQLNSFTNISNPAAVFTDTVANLYHSRYDRLVPVDNTLTLTDTLGGNAIHHDDQCDSNGFRIIFETTDKVGVIHTLCGLNTLDTVFAELR